MENLSFKLSITTATKEICSRDVSKLIATSTDGQFQILRNHVPFLVKLIPGCIFFEDIKFKKLEGLVLSGGILEFQPGQAFIFADSVIRTDDIDLEKSKKEEESLLQKLFEIKNTIFEKKTYDFTKNELLLASAKLHLIKQIQREGLK